ncbi:MAG: hypothetical protein XD72_1924 [Methanothrix harundinacea]|jgi:hypothetical protein|uniref:Uncharacterized protein n=1 Tax=Methanothrix harundinacea TaxID=301375 RepID=A0A101FSS8_9EURY|nr:MAG: hypothetical protein XD72_1924 [Methanothrix harundinacea]KUK94681.1 MAG: hypothetical protein XE07_2090 [Methanothrix harundinacea]
MDLAEGTEVTEMEKADSDRRTEIEGGDGFDPRGV